MHSKPLTLYIIKVAVIAAVMYVAIQIGIAWGVEEKSWIQMSWELIAGGTFGAIAGLAFFVLFGTIGWVCGALYGSIGIVALMLGGALGGLGLGSLANIARDPEKYNFNWLILISILAVGFLVAMVLSSMAVRVASRSISPTPRA